MYTIMHERYVYMTKLNNVNLSEIFVYFINSTNMYLYDYYDFYIGVSNLKRLLLNLFLRLIMTDIILFLMMIRVKS